MKRTLATPIVLAALAGCLAISGVRHPEKAAGALGVYVRGESLEDAGDALDKAAAARPKDPLLRYVAGDVQYLMGDFNEAADELLEAVRLAAKKKDVQSDIIAQLSLSTLDVTARYIRDYDARLAAVLDEAWVDLYRNSDGAFFSALTARINLLLRQGSFDEALKTGDEEGCLQSWRKTGPFGATDLLGFDVVYPPEVDSPWREAYTLRDNEDPSPVSSAATEACWTTLGTAFGTRGGTTYALTHLEVPAKTEIAFRLTTFDAAALLIDGVEVLRADRRTQIHPSSHIVRTVLGAGVHTLVVKMSSRSTSPAFSLMWKEAAAGDPGLPGQSGIRSRPPDGGLLPVAPPPAGATVAAVDLPDSEMGRLLLADFDVMRGLVTEAKELLVPLEEAYPDSFAVGSRTLISGAVDGFVPYASRMNRTKTKAQSMRKKHPGVWLSYLYLSQVERQSGRPTEAAEIIKDGMTHCPTYPEFMVELADIYDELGWSGESVSLLKKAAEAQAGTCYQFRIEHMLASKTNDLDGMEKSAALAAACNATDRTLVDVLVAKDKWSEALEKQTKLLEGYKDDRWLRMDAAWSAFKLGDEAAYEKALTEAIEKDPASLNEAAKLADLFASQGKHPEASAALLGAMAQVDGPPAFVHQKLAAMEAVPYLFHYRRSFQEAVASFNAAGKVSYGDTPAIEVLDHATTRVYEDGSSLTRYHSIRKLLTREGVEKNGEFAVPETAVVLKIHTIKPDGTVLEPEKIYDKPTISYPSLEPGDFTETEYVQYTPPSTIFPGGTFLDRWYFQVPDLVLHRSEMVLITPETMKVDLNTRGTVPEPKVTVENGLTIRFWEVKQSAHVKYEPGAPNLNEFLPSLQVTWRTAWSDYEAWVRDILIDTLTVTPEMQRTLDEITEGIPDGKPQEKARAIYRWVCEEIQEEEGLLTPVSYIFHDKRGDKTKLLYSLLQAAGIPSELHIAETIYADKTVTDVPDFNRFTHFVVKTGEDWIMPAFRKAWYGFLPYPVYGQKTKRIYPDAGEDAIPALAPEKDGIDYGLSVKVDGDGESRCTLTVTFTGTKATIVRETLSSIPKGELKLQVESAYLAELFPGATLTSLALPDLDQPSPKLVMKLEFTKPPQEGPVPGSVVVGPLIKSRTAVVWAQLPSRSFPLLIDDNIRIHLRVEIDGLGAWKIMPPPDTQTKVTMGKSLSFDQTVVVDKKGASMTLERTLKVPLGRITPSAYGDFLEFAGTVDEAEGGVYLLVPWY
jgi:predicted Zn-dependent protease